MSLRTANKNHDREAQLDEDNHRISLVDVLDEIQTWADYENDKPTGSGTGGGGAAGDENERAAFIRGLHAHGTKSFETRDVPSRPHTPDGAAKVCVTRPARRVSIFFAVVIFFLSFGTRDDKHEHHFAWMLSRSVNLARFLRIYRLR